MKIKSSKLFEGLLPETIKPCDNKLPFLKQYNERQTWVFWCWKLLYKCMWVILKLCAQSKTCSGPRSFLNLARRCAANAVRLALLSTFSYGLGNVLRVCLLDLPAGMHEIVYLRTMWWWLGEALRVWNTAAILTQYKHLWLLVSFSLFAPKLTCTSSPIENLDRSDASRCLRQWERFSPSPF
jgi:hypothetical protein